MNSRKALILITLIFVVSPIAAWLIHSGVLESDAESKQGKNRGELIHPARPLGEFALEADSGEVANIKAFEGFWTMLEIAPASCEEDCLKNIYKMRQIRLALGKDAHRVQRVVVTVKDHTLQKIMEDNPGTVLMQLIPESEAFLQKFPDYVGSNISSVSGRIYIIDPLGNLMMRYSHDADPSDVLKDLRQLLKATWIRPRT